MEFSNHTTSIAAATASNGTTSNATPHRKNAAQRNPSDSPYQQRTTQRDNPTQVLIKQAVDYLIEQLAPLILTISSSREAIWPAGSLCSCAAFRLR